MSGDNRDNVRKIKEANEPSIFTVELPFDCPWCESSLVSFNAILEGFVCAECDRRWSTQTATERALRLADFDDELIVTGVSKQFEFPLLVRHVDFTDSKIVGTAHGNESIAYRLFVQSDGTAILDDDEVVEALHSNDPWAEAATAGEAEDAGWERPDVDNLSEEYGRVVPLRDGTTLHHTFENRLLDVVEQTNGYVRADPRDGDEVIKISRIELQEYDVII